MDIAFYFTMSVMKNLNTVLCDGFCAACGRFFHYCCTSHTKNVAHLTTTASLVVQGWGMWLIPWVLIFWLLVAWWSRAKILLVCRLWEPGVNWELSHSYLRMSTTKGMPKDNDNALVFSCSNCRVLIGKWLSFRTLVFLSSENEYWNQNIAIQCKSIILKSEHWNMM